MANIYLSAEIAESLNEKEQYVKNKGFDDEFYRELIIKYLKQFQFGSRADFRKLLWDKLPDSLNDQQKENKVRNIIASLKKTKRLKK